MVVVMLGLRLNRARGRLVLSLTIYSFLSAAGLVYRPLVLKGKYVTLATYVKTVDLDSQ